MSYQMIDNKTFNDVDCGSFATHSLRAISLNVHSLEGKVPYLRTLAALCEVDLLLLTETWFDTSYQDVIENYILTAKSSRTDTVKGRYGGSAIYVKDDPNLTVLRIY